ncbi:MAG: hypothetical protein ACPG2Y_00340 [Acholeplasmataceae bacterium]
MISLIIPVIFLIAMYQPMDPYYKDNDQLETLVFNEVISDGFEMYAQVNESELPLSFSINENQVNQYMFDVLKTTNASFDTSRTYVTEETQFGYAGSWFLFDDDAIELVSKLDVFVIPNFNYQTSLRIVFDIDFDGDIMTLQIKNIYIGNLPILWMLDVAVFGLNLAGIDLVEEISDLLNQFGTYQHEEKILSLSVSDVLNQQINDNETSEFITVLLSNLQQNDLFEIESEASSLSFVIHLEKLSDLTEPIDMLQFSDIQSFDQATIQLFESINYVELFQSVVTRDENVSTYAISIDANDINPLLFVATNDLFPILFDVSDFRIEMQHPYVEIDNEILLNVPLRLFDENNNVVFQTIIQLETELLFENNQSMMSLKGLYIGDSGFDQAFVYQILMIAQLPIDNNAIDITDIMSILTNQLPIETILTQGKNLVLEVEAATLVPIETQLDDIELIVDALSDIEALPDDIQASLDGIVAAIQTNDSAAINDAFEDFSEIYDALDDTMRSEIESIIFDYIEDTAIIDSILN